MLDQRATLFICTSYGLFSSLGLFKSVLLDIFNTFLILFIRWGIFPRCGTFSVHFKFSFALHLSWSCLFSCQTPAGKMKLDSIWNVSSVVNFWPECIFDWLQWFLAFLSLFLSWKSNLGFINEVWLLDQNLFVVPGALNNFRPTNNYWTYWCQMNMQPNGLDLLRKCLTL